MSTLPFSLALSILNQIVKVAVPASMAVGIPNYSRTTVALTQFQGVYTAGPSDSANGPECSGNFTVTYDASTNSVYVKKQTGHEPDPGIPVASFPSIGQGSVVWANGSHGSGSQVSNYDGYSKLINIIGNRSLLETWTTTASFTSAHMVLTRQKQILNGRGQGGSIITCGFDRIM